MPMILYLPEMAPDPVAYWRDCAVKWDRRADSDKPEYPRLESLIEADWCRSRAGDKPLHKKEIRKLTHDAARSPRGNQFVGTSSP